MVRRVDLVGITVPALDRAEFCNSTNGLSGTQRDQALMVRGGLDRIYADVSQPLQMKAPVQLQAGQRWAGTQQLLLAP